MNPDNLSSEEFGLFRHLAKDFVDRSVREWRAEHLAITRIGQGLPGEVLPMLEALSKKGRVTKTDDGVFRLTRRGQLEARELVS